MIDEITIFRGEYSFLSNFHRCRIVYEGMEYSSSEHAYQAAKSTDTLEKRAIQLMETPALARSAGRSRVVIRSLRPDWEDVKDKVMLDILRIKFAIPELREKLLATGDAALVEGNNHGDRFWGVCNGKGLNMLGILLMRVRAEIRSGR